MTLSADPAVFSGRTINASRKITVFVLAIMVSALVLFSFSAGAKAQSAAENEAMSQVSALLASAHKAAGDLDALSSVVKTYFAVGTWTNALLGDDAKKFSSGQSAEFKRLFPSYIAKQYFKQFGGAGGNPGKATKARTVRGDVLVTSSIPGRNRTFTVVWRMRVIGGKPLVIDYSTGGISAIVLRRSEFQSKIQQSGPDGLNSFLKSFIAS